MARAKSMYLEEAAALQALRVLSDWVHSDEMKLYDSDEIRIYAGH